VRLFQFKNIDFGLKEYRDLFLEIFKKIQSYLCLSINIKIIILRFEPFTLEFLVFKKATWNSFSF